METLRQKLNKIVVRLKPYNPEKIILYGSYARGEARKYSDIDLLIIKKTKKPYFSRIGDIQKLLYKREYYFDPKEFIEGLDPIVYTPREVKRLKQRGSFFIEDILKEGKVIYERKQR